MKTIQERAKHFAEGYENRDLSTGLYFGFIVGSETQRIRDEDLRTKKREAMTESEYNREVAFLDWWMDNNSGTITHSDAIEWARKDLLDKACEWMDRYLHLFVMKDHINHSALEQEFRKALEE